MVEIDFLFENCFSKIYWITNKEKSNDVRGIYILKTNDILINLDAEQWKGISEYQLIKEISKTITHECVHYSINKITKDLDDIFYYVEGEEYICNLLSNQ
ncbi:MAG: hypothetical protein ACOCRK_10570 [bacterium]